MTAAEVRKAELLIVDDDRELAETLRMFLVTEGYSVAVALTPAEALTAIEANPGLAAVLSDLVMPEMDGMALAEKIHRINPKLPVVIMTGFGTIETAVEAIKRGAEDYLTKPFDREAVRKKIGRIMEVNRLRRTVERLESEIDRVRNPFAHMIYVSDAMRRLVDQARMAATSDAPILILGETGTGKELLARAVHNASPRSSGPFIGVNCAALPHDLIEAELFGVSKGAFTGASENKPGIFLAANGGTVFLDEIGDMPREAQVKLLRVLEEKEVRPVGGTKTTPVNVRIVSATNQPLSALRTGSLREDLYFRLATVVLELPTLHARGADDVTALTHHFCAMLSRNYGRTITVSAEALDELRHYPFPGNVRELYNMLDGQAAIAAENPQVISGDAIAALAARATTANHQATPQRSSAAQGDVDTSAGEGVPYSLRAGEAESIRRALIATSGRRAQAARLLGISRDTLWRKMRDYNIPGEL